MGCQTLHFRQPNGGALQGDDALVIGSGVLLGGRGCGEGPGERGAEQLQGGWAELARGGRGSRL